MSISLKKIQVGQRSRSATVSDSSLPAIARKVYGMLTLATALAAVGGYVSVSIGISSMMSLVLSLVALGLIIAMAWFHEGLLGLFLMYAVTTLLGMSTGPMVEHYLHMSNGPAIVFQAVALTAGIFGGLSIYAIVSKKDFSFLGGFLFISLLVLIVMGIVNIFLHSPVMNMVYSAGIAIIMSGYILYDTSRMIRAGENEAIMITLSLFLDILNLFISLLQILGALESDD